MLDVFQPAVFNTGKDNPHSPFVPLISRIQTGCAQGTDHPQSVFFPGKRTKLDSPHRRTRFGARLRAAFITQNGFGARIRTGRITQNGLGARVRAGRITQRGFGARFRAAFITQNGLRVRGGRNRRNFFIFRKACRRKCLPGVPECSFP